MSISCDDVLANTSAIMNNAIEKGSWGGIPAGLQHTPPGSTLCGSLGDMIDGGVTGAASKLTLVLSNLKGADLYTFYAPYVTAVGCTLAQPDSNGFLTFQCSGGHSGTISADLAYQFFAISYLE